MCVVCVFVCVWCVCMCVMCVCMCVCMCVMCVYVCDVCVCVCMCVCVSCQHQYTSFRKRPFIYRIFKEGNISEVLGGTSCFAHVAKRS